MTNLGLGRRPSKDDRDQQFLMRTVLSDEELLDAPLTGRKYWWDNGSWTDQGATGTCVGHAAVAYLEDSPIRHPDVGYDPYEIYRKCLNIDEWPENDWVDPNAVDYDSGTSIHAMAKMLAWYGNVAEYRWAFDLDTVLRWLRYKGPIVVGTSWYWSMFETERRADLTGTYRQFMNVDTSSGMAGGHAYLWNGVNFDAGVIRVKLQSWDRDSFGSNGRANLDFDSAEFLIDDWGEIMIASELRL